MLPLLEDPMLVELTRYRKPLGEATGCMDPSCAKERGGKG
jgi:hypothetical protein